MNNLAPASDQSDRPWYLVAIDVALHHAGDASELFRGHAGVLGFGVRQAADRQSGRFGHQGNWDERQTSQHCGSSGKMFHIGRTSKQPQL